MSLSFLHNQDYLPIDTPVFDLNNRSFKFGDGFFESARIINGSVPLLNRHYNRIIKTAQMLKMQMPDWLTKEQLKTQIEELIKRNNITNGGRLRMSFYRDSKGSFYTPQKHTLSIVIEAEQLNENEFKLSQKGLTIDLYNEIRKPLNFISNLKTNNSLVYIMAAIYAQENNLDNVILLNDNYNVAEMMNANIFIVSNGVIYTPPITEGCLDGVMRGYVIECANRLGIKVYENIMKPNDLIRADEVFVTNASSGVQWVSAYKSKRYFNTTAEKITTYINAIIATEENVALVS